MSRQQRLLLAYLLVHPNSFVAADRLVAELWGADPPRDPSAALRTQVSRLRRRLPPRALHTEPGGLRLAVEPGELDSDVFEELLRDGQVEAALRLWRGAAFNDFADRPFAQVEAQRLEQLRLHAEELRARTLLARGEPAEAAIAAGALLAEHPERESVRAVVMEALYRAGQQRAAVEVYQSWREELSEHFGLEPTPELSRLNRDILRHRLPVPMPARPVDSFLGRGDDVSRASQLLRTARLLTLTGPGGVGKSRLAVEAAHALVADFPDGAVVCELTSVSQPDAVPRALARAVGLTETADVPLPEQLVAHLLTRRQLIVLDGCEHVLDAAAEIARDLVQRTAGIAVLATSRERLAVPGEHVQRVGPLPPDIAMRLFRDRAHASNGRLAVSDERVAAVCAHLDGLPLAIELAAARAGSLRLEEMVPALADPFTVLVDRRRSLSATLQWSFQLLSDEEQDAFCRLAMFHGDFDRTMAAGLGVDTGVLLRLSERSLLSGASPYRMLDSVRAYGRQQLRDQQRLDEMSRQHAELVLEFAVTAARALPTADEARWAQRIEIHFAELRAAQEWLRAHDPGRAAELVCALRAWALWRAQAEVFHWAETVFTETGHPLAAACAAAGAWQRGDLAAAAALAAAAGPQRAAIEALAELAFLRGELAEAQRQYRRAAQRARDAGDGLQEIWCEASVILAAVYAGDDAAGDGPDSLLVRANDLGSPSAIAMAHFVIGEARRSVPALVEAITLADTVGSRFVAGLARVALASLHARSSPAAALGEYAHVIAQWQQTGAWAAQMVTFRTLVELLARMGASRAAAVLYGANEAAGRGVPAFGRDAAMLQTLAGRLQRELGIDEFTTCRQQGASLTKEEMVAYALATIKQLRADV